MANSSQREKRCKSAPTRSTSEIAQTTLNDLPNEVLTDIISKLSVSSHNTTRAISGRFRDLSNKYILMQFKKAVGQAEMNPATEETAALLVLHWATEIYLHSGLDSKFCDSLLALLQNPHKEQLSFVMNRAQLYEFLAQFLGSVYVNCDNSPQSQQLLLNAAVLRLLGKFENSNVRWISSGPFHARFLVELTGVWLGWVPPRPIPRGIPETPHYLIVMLAELLLAHKTGIAFEQYREGSCFELFIYGTKARRRIVPTTSFTMQLFGVTNVALFFKSCLEEPETVFLGSAEMPKNQFTLSYNISSREATRKGCAYLLKFVSEAETENPAI